MTGKVFDIVRSSFVDGPGIRTTVFFKGCNLRCAWCHNPEGKSSLTQLMFYKDKCIGCGKCKEVCPYNLEKCDLCGKCAAYCPQEARKLCGEKKEASEIFEEIVKDKDFYLSSGGGVTFSGGECMLQIDFLNELIEMCKAEGIHTAVDTAGNVPLAYFAQIDPDMYLYDIKCLNVQKHKEYVGADNLQILSNLQWLLKQNKRVWIRIPVIADVNDTEEEMTKINGMLKTFGYPEKVELLPYHSMGENKLRALGENVPEFKAPSEEHMEKLRACFK